MLPWLGRRCRTLCTLWWRCTALLAHLWRRCRTLSALRLRARRRIASLLACGLDRLPLFRLPVTRIGSLALVPCLAIGALALAACLPASALAAVSLLREILTALTSYAITALFPRTAASFRALCLRLASSRGAPFPERYRLLTPHGLCAGRALGRSATLIHLALRCTALGVAVVRHACILPDVVATVVPWPPAVAAVIVVHRNGRAANVVPVVMVHGRPAVPPAFAIMATVVRMSVVTVMVDMQAVCIPTD